MAAKSRANNQAVPGAAKAKRVWIERKVIRRNGDVEDLGIQMDVSGEEAQRVWEEIRDQFVDVANQAKGDDA